MSWRIEVDHLTRYRYGGQVLASYNEARLTPATGAGQLTLDAGVEVEPRARLGRYRDHWGTLVHTFDLQVPHDELVVRSRALVETVSWPTLAGTGCTWAELEDAAMVDRFFEDLAPTPLTTLDAARLEVAAGLRAAADHPEDAVVATEAWVREALHYEQGTTTVATTAVEALELGRGVCQDFAHITIGTLRAMGVPARYVSGYFLPQPEVGLGETVAGESHAWVEAWLGGWRPLDPTNAVEVGERHIAVARGRDYRDVPPLKGVCSGAAPVEPEVRVSLTRRA